MKKQECLDRRNQALAAAKVWQERGEHSKAQQALIAADFWFGLADMHWKTRDKKIATDGVVDYPVPAEDKRHIVEQAIDYIESLGVARYANGSVDGPEAVRDYLRLKLHYLQHEEFWCIYLSNQNQIIDAVRHHIGTLNSCAVHPREIVKTALQLHANQVILAHNHPTWVGKPSTNDELLTRKMKAALELVDCKVLDHFIVAGGRYYSFAERGVL